MTKPVQWKTEVKHGRLYFHIGVQSFPVDYTPEDEPEWSAGDAMAWMEKRLHEALSNLAAAPQPPEQPAQQEPFKHDWVNYRQGLHDGWAEGYEQGVADERTSEDNIGIAGFGAKVNPARENPYKSTAPHPPVIDKSAAIRIATALGWEPKREPLTDERQPKSEPTAWQWLNTANFRKHLPDGAIQSEWRPLYASPQAREWVGLTDEDLLRCLGPEACRIPFGWYKLARAIEAKLKEKNCG